MIEQVFTFGSGHVCPFTGRKLGDHYVTIVAEDRTQARMVMLATFGQAWSHQYDSVAAAKPRSQPDYPLVEHIRIEVRDPGEAPPRYIVGSDGVPYGPFPPAPETDRSAAAAAPGDGPGARRPVLGGDR